MIAALYVQTNGCYYGLEKVDPWDEKRDARTYDGPWPVVAHPPCARWGRYWFGGPSARERRKLGDDGGCFAAALDAVRRFGGVLEHPEATHAWRAHAIVAPPKRGGWVEAHLPLVSQGLPEAWTCCVEQGHYGHLARKATWLYYVGAKPEPLIWGKAEGKTVRLDEGFHSAAERIAAKARGRDSGMTERLSARQRAATPVEFRDLLISLAESAR